MALPKRKKSPSPMLGLDRMSRRMPEGGWFTPVVLPHMFSRKNPKSWEHCGGSDADPSVGCETWLALHDRFDLAKTSVRKTPRTMKTRQFEQPLFLFIHSCLAEKGIRDLSLPLTHAWHVMSTSFLPPRSVQWQQRFRRTPRMVCSSWGFAQTLRRRASQKSVELAGKSQTNTTSMAS